MAAESVTGGGTRASNGQVDQKQYQIFDCYVFKQWPAQKVATELRVSIAQVYLAKHRLGALLKKELAAAERVPA